MGQKATKQIPKVTRKAGDPMNVYNLPAVHTEFVYPSRKRTMNYSICRCWQSSKFPICDNSHKKLQWQGCNCDARCALISRESIRIAGPVMLEIRQAPSLTPVGTSSSQNGPTPIALFGCGACVSALLAVLKRASKALSIEMSSHVFAAVVHSFGSL
ncbi:hypothetical protein Esti_004051 [Eimeria stiedai]